MYLRSYMLSNHQHAYEESRGTSVGQAGLTGLPAAPLQLFPPYDTFCLVPWLSCRPLQALVTGRRVQEAEPERL